jgi:hypothetical protein
MICRFCGLETGESSHHRSEADCNRALADYVLALKQRISDAVTKKLPSFTRTSSSSAERPRLHLDHS